LAYRNYEENLLEQPYQSAALVGGASYGLGALGSAGKLGSFSQSATSMFSKPAFSSLGFGTTQTAATPTHSKTKFISKTNW
jgi:hypothetical protein